ncbi:MAG TPA: hypothetical protein VGJ59_11485 [Jatrophihabitantaceae bacterium]
MITSGDGRVATCPTRTAAMHARPRRRLVPDACRLPRPVGLPTVIALTVVAVVVSSCGSGRVNPTRSPTLSGLASRPAASTAAPPSQSAAQTGASTPSRSRPQTQTQTTTPIQTQTATQTQTETATQTQVRTQTQVQTKTQVQTQTQTQTRTAVALQSPTPTPASNPSTQATAAASGSTSSSPPAWLWWLIGALVLTAAVVTGLLLRKRSRKRAWAENLTATKDDVAWFARELIPRLEQAPTAQQIAGGWRMEADRVVAVEDRLTMLEAAAVDDVGRNQARSLRDAVRGSRTRLTTLDTTDDRVAAVNLLRATATDLETALASVDPSAPRLEGEMAPRSAGG